MRPLPRPALTALTAWSSRCQARSGWVRGSAVGAAGPGSAAVGRPGPGWRRLLGVALLGALGALLLAGCDFLAMTDEQLVKNKMREHDEAVSKRDWRTAATFYDRNVKWQYGTVSLQGRDAAKGFLESLNAMSQMDSFYCVVNSTRKISSELIEADVTMQAHLVLSSAELNFSNRFWGARMGWVKRGPGKWQISYIIETAERKEGKFSRI